MDRLTLQLLRLRFLLLQPRSRGERGDVPGWVLVTVMTASIVAALYALAKPQLTQMLRSALHSVQ